MCKGNQRATGHVHANTRKSIHTEEYLFQESLVECHYQASHKTTRARSGFLGLASKATLFMKNKKEPYIIYLICPCLKLPSSTESPVVFRTQTRSLCRRWGILGDRGTVSPASPAGRLTCHSHGRNAARCICRVNSCQRAHLGSEGHMAPSPPRGKGRLPVVDIGIQSRICHVPGLPSSSVD